jgi:hypothetical protein
MTNYPAPFEQKWASDQAVLMQRVATLERQIAQLTSGPVAVTSSTHPASPVPGQQVLETDTGLTAQWSGTTWVYPPQRLDQKMLAGTAASITLHVPTAPAFSALRVTWSARGDNATPATFMCVQLNGDTAARYVWQLNQANVAAVAGGNSAGAVTQIEVGTMAAATASAGYVGSGEFVIPNASGATFKGVSGHSTSENAAANGYSGSYGGLWAATAAITSITLFPLNGNLVAGSAAYLYGET